MLLLELICAEACRAASSLEFARASCVLSLPVAFRHEIVGFSLLTVCENPNRKRQRSPTKFVSQFNLQARGVLSTFLRTLAR
jgi:hypothetical protein